jgi:hypothetical protein
MIAAGPTLSPLKVPHAMEIDTILYLMLSDVIQGRLQSSCAVCQKYMMSVSRP